MSIHQTPTQEVGELKKLPYKRGAYCLSEAPLAIEATTEKEHFSYMGGNLPDPYY